MDDSLSCLRQPKFRQGVSAVVGTTRVDITYGASHCGFDVSEDEAPAVSRLIDHLGAGGLTVSELESHSPEIAEQLPRLLEDFDRLRLLTESTQQRIDGVRSGAQLYREVRRLSDRLIARIARSEFQRALLEGNATRQQLIGYALEYYWIVQAAPGLIGPALGTVKSSSERRLLQDFLKSELGHDRLLAAALQSVGLTQDELDIHQPLPATFALCASLGVYARQDPLSFKACLFLFERAQPAFIDAFDIRCRALGLPEAFYGPLRAHSEINDEYDHEDISRLLMELESAVDPEYCIVVKRHVSIMIETLLQQETQILHYYGEDRDRIPRTSG